MDGQDAHIQKGSGPGERLRLPEKLDLRASLDLLSELQARRGADLTIDASAVQHLGAHAVQTLLVAAASWARDRNTLTITDLSETASGHLSALGLEPELLTTGGAT